MDRRISRIFVVALATIALIPITLRAQATAEEQAIKKVVEQSFSAFEKKEIDSVMACWSTKSPQLAEFRQFALTGFATLTDLQFLNLTFTRWKIDATRAVVRRDADFRFRVMSTVNHSRER